MKLSKFCNKISLILQALWCAVLYFLIEALCRHSVVEAWDYMTGKPLVFAYNTAFIFTTMLIVYLFHRRVFWRVVVSVFWLFLGIVNCILLLNRVTPFTGPDLHMLTDGIAIMQKYLPFYGVVIGCIIIGLVLFALLILFIKGPKYQQKIKYRYVIPMIVVGAGDYTWKAPWPRRARTSRPATGSWATSFGTPISSIPSTRPGEMEFSHWSAGCASLTSTATKAF